MGESPALKSKINCCYKSSLDVRVQEVLEKKKSRKVCQQSILLPWYIKMCQLPKLLEAGVTIKGQIGEGQASWRSGGRIKDKLIRIELFSLCRRLVKTLYYCKVALNNLLKVN